jgi:bifunctional NMN adenylyltransferase/nudix hydrolase
MRKPEFAAVLLIGRFQPFHNGHAALLAAALARAECVLVVLGSAHQARSVKNPFSWEERAAQITLSLSPEDATRVHFLPLRDYYDDTRWTAALRQGVASTLARHGVIASRVALLGFEKDASGYYLALFPEWTRLALERQGAFDATIVRQHYFAAATPEAGSTAVAAQVPAAVARWLAAFPAADFLHLRREQAALAANKAESVPVVSVLALCTLADRMLLTRRHEAPGEDLWALPEADPMPRETLYQAAFRALQTASGLALANLVPVGETRFDHPARSQRGQRIAQVHHFHLAGLPDFPVMPPETRIFPRAALPALETELFEDHFHILARCLDIPE